MSHTLRSSLAASLESVGADKATQAAFMQALEAAMKEKMTRAAPLSVTITGTIDVLRDNNGRVSGIISNPVLYGSAAGSVSRFDGKQATVEF